MDNFSDQLQNYYNWMGVRSELLEILLKLENFDKENLCLFKKTHPFKYLPVSSRRIQQFIDLSLIPKPNGVKYSYGHIIFYFYSILMRKKGYSFNQLSDLSLKLSLEEAEKKSIKPLAKIVAHSTNSHEPNWFTTAPIGAISKVIDKSGWKKQILT